MDRFNNLKGLKSLKTCRTLKMHRYQEDLRFPKIKGNDNFH